MKNLAMALIEKMVFSNNTFRSNRWYKIKLISMLMVVLSGCMTVQAEERLRIMTFNVPMGNIPAEGLNTWANRCTGIQAFIDSVRPDLLGMQEPVVIELRNLLSGMPNYSMLGVARDDGIESGEYSPIIYRTDRFMVEKTGSYWLSKTPDVISKDWGSACRRIATWAIFIDKKTRTRFLYTNTHLDHISDSARENQMKVIKSKMYALSESEGNIPMMLTGDFNVVVSSTTYPIALNYLVTMDDAWNKAVTKQGPAYTFTSSQKKIDYIMVTPEIGVTKAYIHSSYMATGQILSDHNAHYADVYWNTNIKSQSDSLIQVAQNAYDSTLCLQQENIKLVNNTTDGDSENQASSDGLDTSEGQYYRYLTDGSFFTYVHSRYNTPLPSNNPHYLQIDLKRTDVDAFVMAYCRRDNDTYGPADRWQDVMITASNDAINWDYVTELYNFGGDLLKYYYSPIIYMHRPYRYVRFSVMHTPAMKIRNANPQYSVSEFQMYHARVNIDDSQRYYNVKVKKACDSLLVQMTATSAFPSLEQYGKLTTAIATLRAVKLQTALLNEQVAKATALLANFTVGSQYGQSTKEDSIVLLNIINEIKSTININSTKEQVDSCITKINTGMDSFLASLKNIENNKWYYIASLNPSKVNGSVIYTTSKNDTEAVLLGEKDLKGNTLNGGVNAGAMWRKVLVSELPQKYGLQNRATGFYLGKYDSIGNNYVMSPTPLACDIILYGVNDFHFLSAGSDSLIAGYVSTGMNDKLCNARGGYKSVSSWIFNEVPNDETLGYVDIPFFNNYISIVCFPYAIDNLMANNPTVQTYTMNSSPSTGTFTFEKKSTFVAGEPFVIAVGDCNAFDANNKDTIMIHITPPQSYVSEGLSINGMTGLLAQTRMYKIMYRFVNSRLIYQTSTESKLDGETGYIIRSKVQATGNPVDITVRINSDVMGTKSISTDVKKEKVDIISLNGTTVRSGVKSSDALSGLKPGVYLVGKQKVLVP